MKGDVVYQNGSYVETVEAEAANGVRMIECTEDGTTGLFRVEWEEQGHPQHSAFLDYTSAANNFERRSTES